MHPHMKQESIENQMYMQVIIRCQHQYKKNFFSSKLDVTTIPLVTRRYKTAWSTLTFWQLKNSRWRDRVFPEKRSSKCETNTSTHKAACHHRGIIWIAVDMNILSLFCLQQIHNMETQQKHLTTALQVWCLYFRRVCCPWDIFKCW